VVKTVVVEVFKIMGMSRVDAIVFQEAQVVNSMVVEESKIMGMPAKPSELRTTAVMKRFFIAQKSK
jgi:hypothetical protein